MYMLLCASLLEHLWSNQSQMGKMSHLLDDADLCPHPLLPTHPPNRCRRCGRSWRPWLSRFAWWLAMICIGRRMTPTASSSCKKVSKTGLSRMWHDSCVIIMPATAQPLQLQPFCLFTTPALQARRWPSEACTASAACCNYTTPFADPGGLAGEALALRGMHCISCLHGPAVVGQAAVFSAYVDECRSRLHTGDSHVLAKENLCLGVQFCLLMLSSYQ